MARAYSKDLRERVAGALAQGKSARSVAALFDLSESTAIRWAQRLWAVGRADPLPRGGDRRSRLTEQREAILTLIAQHPDLTLAEIPKFLTVQHGIAVSITTIWRFFDVHGITVKKSLHPAEHERPDVFEARRNFIRRQPSFDRWRLVFLDETASTTAMTRRRGRCAKGMRLTSPVPHGHWKTTTLVCGLRATGITAPYVQDGALNGPSFLTYVEQILAPSLVPGDVVVMDNVVFYKVSGIQEAVEAAGEKRLYLPPYIPDLNPIEQAYAKIKTFLRKAGVLQLHSELRLCNMIVKRPNATFYQDLSRLPLTFQVWAVRDAGELESTRTKPATEYYPGMSNTVERWISSPEGRR